MKRPTIHLAPPPPRTAARERLMSARAPGIALTLGTLLAILGAGESRAAPRFTTSAWFRLRRDAECDMPLPTPRRVAAHGGGSARARIGALLFGLAFLLGAAEVRAAAVCSNTPGANDWIRCTQTGTADIDIDLANPAISTTGPGDEGIWAEHTGTGNIDIDVTGGSIAAADAFGVRARHEAAGAIDIDLTNVDVSTQGQLDNGVSAQHRGTSGTGIDIDVTGGSVTTAGADSYGVYAAVNDSTGVAVGAAISIDTKNTRVSTMGLRGYGVFGSLTTAASTAPLSVNVAGGSVATAGQNAHAVRAYRFSQTGTGAITVGVTDGAALSTTGVNAHGVLITQNGLAGIDADLTDAVISTANTSSYGFMGWLRNNSGSPLLDIDIVRGSVKTTGARSYGILGYIDRNASASALSIDADGVAVSTTGYRSYGVFALSLGTGSVDVDLEDVAISTTGDESYGVVGNIRYAVSTAAIAIEAAGDRAITVEGLNAAGILGLQAGRGSVRVTTGAETSIEAPFAVGMEARATNDAGAAGRVVVTHEGAAEARYAGVVALAARSSGHTFGDGAQTADDDARTAPMIAVASSGTVTVGASVMDAFVRDRIAGADETLSAAEQAVLDAVTAEDSDALDTALAALPAAYDDDWKAEARNLLRKRIAEPDAARAANRAAEEILGLSRAGVRAVALSHTGMATFIRQGDRDPAILAIAAASRTEQQQEALAEQEKLSTAERTVLEAALTGSGLETALAALPGAAYTDDWKDGVRQRAASYNAGGVQVDVTGGAITAEGNGVEALYAVPHERNGAIAVTVSAGARVTGGANGIYVRGGGAGEGDLRAQSVTVNGGVMGGTGAGAGVRMIDGGRLTVGKTGRIGATSGVGVLSDGAGDLHATVAGTVEGDIRVTGTGALTLAVREGGVVTGTVRDPLGLPTVVGSIGRLLYTSGATVTVAATGALTGVEGEAEALRSEVGDLDLTVAGRVAGDLRAPGGGTLKLSVREGGAVTGTVHDPVGTLTVAGSIGRLLYTSGATVTVARTGSLTGVEGEAEALRSEAGDLDLTVAGRVAGDLRAPGGGTLKLSVREGGAVTGTVHDPVGTLTVAGSIGRLLYTSGATVTVARTGSLTGVEGEAEALRSEAGDLDVTVAGMVAGDLRAPSGGTLTLNLREGGAVTGTVHDPAGLPTVVGSIGRLLYTSGATVTVADLGKLTGVEVDGRTEALRSEAGDLDLTVAGMVTGDVFGLGAGEHTVTVSNGGTVTGTVHLAASTVTVHGRAGRVRFDKGGMVTVGSTGRITGIEGVAIRNEAGDLVVSVAGRVGGDINVAGAGSEVRVDGTVEGRIRFRRGGMVTVGRDGKVEGRVSKDGELMAVIERKPEETTRAAARKRAFPGGIDLPDDEIVLKPELADHEPRMRVYEALPSVLLGLNRLPEFRDRMAAPRTADGAGWARVETFRGKWKADESVTPGLEYDYRRHGLKAGVDATVGEHGLLGVSLHHRRGTAEVSGGGDVKLSGHGVGMSGAWLVDDVYVDVQAEATWYEAALSATGRGVLKTDVPGRGHALGVEVGRRVTLERLPAGLVLTPRAGLVHSRVSMGGFTDAVGARVSVEDGRSLKGRAGMAVEMEPGGAWGSRVFGTVDVEHEFSRDTKVVVSGTELKSEAEATWLRLGLNGVHAWDEGRSTVQGGVSYATGGGGHELGGGVSLSVRF